MVIVDDSCGMLQNVWQPNKMQSERATRTVADDARLLTITKLEK
jgi:hypothetical protein